MNKQMEQILKAVSFPVEKRKLAVVDERGKFTPYEGRMAVVRADTGQPLSVVSDNYALVRHDEVLRPLLDRTVLARHWDLVERPDTYRMRDPLQMERSGARVMVTLALARDGIKIGSDTIVPRLVVGNSYDTTTSLFARFGFHQISCANIGALIVRGEIAGWGGGSFSRRHMGELPLVNCKDLDKRLELFLKDFGRLSGPLQLLPKSKLAVPKTDALYKDGVGAIYAKRHPLGEKEYGSAWGLYSRITNYLTSEFKGVPSMAENRARTSLDAILKEVE